MKMEQEHNYQPVFIRTLLQNSGTATKAQIKQALIEANPDIDIAKNSHLTARDTLLKHNIIADNDDSYSLIDYDDLTIEDRNKLVNLCTDKISEAATYASKISRRLVLFSVSGDASFEHFKDTMQKDIDTTKLSETKMKQFSRIRAWGAIPNKWALSKWSKLKQGDILLFYRDKQYITSAVLEGTEQNNVVAKEMWGTKPDSDITWELIMYMKSESVKTANVDYQKLNKFLNYKENFMPTRTLDFTLVRADTTKDLERRHSTLENALSSIGFDFGKIVTIAQDSSSPGCDKTHSCFIPEELHVKKGDIVTWINTDNAAHTITSGTVSDGPDGKFDSSLMVSRAQFMYKFDESGEHPYHCMVHPWMVGKIMVDKQTTESENYLLLRHNLTRDNPWSDEFGKSYHYGRIANYTKLTSGSKVVWNDRQDGKYLFLGYGEVGNIKEEHIREDLYAEMKIFEKFDPPKIATEELQGKITTLPNFNNQHSILPITKEIYDEIVYGRVSDKPHMKTFEDEPLPVPTPEDLKNGYEKITDELLVPESKVIEIVTALASGRHVLLAGPIGTGKTRLAQIIPKVFWESIGGYYSEDYTATADWSTQDVIAGIFPKMSNEKPLYEIQNGCVVETVAKNWENGINGGNRSYSNPTPSASRGTWLIIDEFNRADIDKAFGQLFTALRTRSLKIPTDQKGLSYKHLKIPEDYRIIGTLNTADKHFLFQLSDALKSRFAYIEIDIPSRNEFEKEIYYAMKNAIEELGGDDYESLIAFDHDNKKIDKENSNEDFYNRVLQAYLFLDLVRIFKKLGTAILKLIYQNLLVGTKITGDSKLALDNSLNSTLIPQLENLSRSALGSIQALYSKDITEFFKNAYKNPNRQSYSDDFAKVLNYLKITNAERLSNEFSNGTLQVDNVSTWTPIKTTHESKKNEFEQELLQLNQSMNEIINSVII
jgi:plastocyanin/MoxR-like ATPase